mmetsp:Transcript_32315/g.65742  ORF Transcript_32315/g.65742 Transcript_32315/m.65742 type:complete len:484 (+) Transcript_32315:193-1644(+)
MPSLSNGALQKATRKAVVSLFNDNSTLRNQLFTDKALAIILSEACGVNIDTDTVSKAFAAGGESRYSLQFKDMSIGYEGESILFVYKVYKLPNDNYFTAVGWFDSVEAAEAVNVDIRRQVTGIAIENEVEEAFKKQLKKDHEKKAKNKSTNKRPPSPSSEKPPSKKPSAATVAAAVEQEQTSNEQPADVDQTAAPTPESSANTPVPAASIATATPELNEYNVTFSMGSRRGKMTVNINSPMYRTLLGNCVREERDDCVREGRDEGVSIEEASEMERAENEEDASNQSADNERKEYTKNCRDVTIGKDTVHNVPYSLDVVQKNYLFTLKKRDKMTDNLMELFKEGRCLVQEINAMARTNVKEARRTVRVVIFVTLNHPYNRESVDKKREERSTMKEKLKVKRVNGAERITGYFNHVEGVLAEAEKAVEEAGEQKYKEIFDHYRKSDNKTSAVEREKKVQGFEAATEKPRNITKNQRRGDIRPLS